MVALRIFININVVWLFAFSVYAVVLVVERSTKQRQTGGWWQQNEVTIVVSLITNLFPFIFELLGSFEQYHPRKRLRIQLARIMVLNLLNLYTFILASFSKISDMTIQLQEIKKNLTNVTAQPSELTMGKQDPMTPTPQMMVTDILITGIMNITQPSTMSTCYIERVNCTTKASEPDNITSYSSLSTGTSMSTEQPSSTVSRLTTLLLLSTILNNNSLPSEQPGKNVSFYRSDINDTDNGYDSGVLKSDRLVDNSYDYDKFNYDSIPENVSDRVSPRHVKTGREPPEQQNNVERQRYIIPLHVELFNYDKYKNESSDDDFLTPEDYPDRNDTDINVDIEYENGGINYTAMPLDIYSTTTDVSTTDDGCHYITVCPDTSTVLPVTRSISPSVSAPTLYFSEPSDTDTKPQPAQPTSTSTNGEIVPSRDVSQYTKSLDVGTRRKLRSLCWETMFGQELVKLTVMDLVLTILSTLVVDFFRAIFVRTMNNCWCWDLEKKFPQYGDFKIAENILHLVNNQGMVWMGMFFSPGLPLINLVKLIVMMYLRSWTVLTCNVPHEVVFRASRSNNFYLTLLLVMLFLCVLPVSYVIVWVEPSWHCGPFSNYEKIYHLFTNSTKKALPNKTIHKALDYIASPGIVIPLLMLLVLVIYYLISLTNALREANNDLKVQLRRERTEERRKVFQMVDSKHRVGGPGDLIESTPFQKWHKTLNVLPSSKSDQTSTNAKEEDGQNSNGVLKADAKKLLSKLTKHTTHRHSNEESVPIVDADGTDIEQVESLPDDRILAHHGHPKPAHHQKTESHTVPADVHKGDFNSTKKHHDEDNTAVRHKVHRHDRFRHTKVDEKHGKSHGTHEKDKKVRKLERKDSNTPAERMQETRTSQSTDDECGEETELEHPSKSSSTDTITVMEIAEETEVERKDGAVSDKKIKDAQKTIKRKEKVEHTVVKEKQIKHHKKDHKDDVKGKKFSIETEHERFIDDEDDSVFGRRHEKHHDKEKHLIETGTIRSKHKEYGKKSDEDKGAEKLKMQIDNVEQEEATREKEVKSRGKEIDGQKQKVKTGEKSRLKHHSQTHADAVSKITARSEITDESDDSEKDKKVSKKKKKHSELEEKDSLHVTPESPTKKEFSFKLKPRHKQHAESSSQVVTKRSSDVEKFIEPDKSAKRSKSDRIKYVDEEPLNIEPYRSPKDAVKLKEKDKTTKEKHIPKENYDIEQRKSHKTDLATKDVKSVGKPKSEEERPYKKHKIVQKDEIVHKETSIIDDIIDNKDLTKQTKSCDRVRKVDKIDDKTEKPKTSAKSRRLLQIPVITESRSRNESDDTESSEDHESEQKPHSSRQHVSHSNRSHSESDDGSLREHLEDQKPMKFKKQVIDGKMLHSPDELTDEDSQSQQSQLNLQRLKKTVKDNDGTSKESSDESINEKKSS